jgi:hypothetical protein
MIVLSDAGPTHNWSGVLYADGLTAEVAYRQ